MQEIHCSVWSENLRGGVMGHRLVRIPLAAWRGLAEWCWGHDRLSQFRQLAGLGTADPPAVLDAAAVRELWAEVRARPPGPHPPEVTAALDALRSFLEEAVEVVGGYSGRPYRVSIVFQRGSAEPAAVPDRRGVNAVSDE
jgi:hypothetical protein